MLNELTNKKCVRCESKTPPLEKIELQSYLKKLRTSWELIDGKKIKHAFIFKTFPEAISFVDRVAEIAEAEGHHPNIQIYYNKVVIELRTHSVGGLSENDFILAAKFETILSPRPTQQP